MAAVHTNPDPIALDAARKRFWGDFWHAAVEEVQIQRGMDRVKFGPLRAHLVAEDADDPALNFVLGADMPGAVDGGHLEDAMAWLESHHVEFRVPVLCGSHEAALAEGRLEALGQERMEGPVLLVRSVSPLRPPSHSGIHVHEHVRAEEAEVMDEALAASLGLPWWASTPFMGLCEADDWHCYSAAIEGEIVAYAAVSAASEAALLVLASVSWDTDGQLAALSPCIADAAAAGCRFVAVADAGSDPEDEEWSGLLEAGFEQVGTYATWQPPVSART